MALWLGLAKSVGKHLKLRSKKRKRSKQDALKGEFNTTEDSLMSLLRLEENEDLMQIRKILILIICTVYVN